MNAGELKKVLENIPDSAKVIVKRETGLYHCRMFEVIRALGSNRPNCLVIYISTEEKSFCTKCGRIENGPEDECFCFELTADWGSDTV